MSSKLTVSKQSFTMSLAFIIILLCYCTLCSQNILKLLYVNSETFIFACSSIVYLSVIPSRPSEKLFTAVYIRAFLPERLYISYSLTHMKQSLCFKPLMVELFDGDLLGNKAKQISFLTNKGKDIDTMLEPLILSYLAFPVRYYAYFCF